MNMLFCILFRYLDFSINYPLLVGERSLDATAGNPLSAVSMIVHGTLMYLNLTFMN